MDIDLKELIQTVTENFDLSKFKGDVVGVKVVENEFGNIEPGGIGIQNIYHETSCNTNNAEEEQEKPNSDIEIQQEPKTTIQERNYFAPTLSLKRLLKSSWIEQVLNREKYNEQWMDVFIDALMASEYREEIACDWEKKDKRLLIKGYILGLLKDAGVLKGSYDKIAENAHLTEKSRTFSRYMGEGKKQHYAGWVINYVSLTER